MFLQRIGGQVVGEEERNQDHCREEHPPVCGQYVVLLERGEQATPAGHWLGAPDPRESEKSIPPQMRGAEEKKPAGFVPPKKVLAGKKKPRHFVRRALHEEANGIVTREIHLKGPRNGGVTFPPIVNRP